jgi:flagellar biosynthesis protein
MREKKKEISVAAALMYDAGRDSAPRVTAKGRGHIADKIIEEARRHGIPIKEDPALVEILSRLDLDEYIPAELYTAVAEILSFVYAVNERYRQERGRPGS